MSSLLLALAVIARLTGYTGVVLITRQNEPSMCACYATILTADAVEVAVMIGLWITNRRQQAEAADRAEAR